MRYKGYPVCGNQYRWSAFSGDPSAKPSEVRAQFAPGWIKRVTSALNPFDTRVDDFISAPVNTTVDMVRQAGPRYEGPVALSNDPETLNNMGLIEAYETVLDRGRKLSIDSGHQPPGRQRRPAQRHLPHRRFVHVVGQRRLHGCAGPDRGAGYKQRPGFAFPRHLRLHEPVPAR